jgi:hypothetical protein
MLHTPRPSILMSELSPLSSRYRRAVIRGAHALPLVPVAQSLPAAVLARFLSERLATTAVINERPKALARLISSSSYCYGTRWARKFYRNERHTAIQFIGIGWGCPRIEFGVRVLTRYRIRRTLSDRYFRRYLCSGERSGPRHHRRHNQRYRQQQKYASHRRYRPSRSRNPR